MKIYNLCFLLFFPFFSACNNALEFQTSPAITGSQQKPNRTKAATANVAFKSADGGQSWQDISEGLPENYEQAGSFVDETGLSLRVGNGLYHSTSSVKAPFWQKTGFLMPDKWESIAPGKAGLFAYTTNGNFLQKKKGTGDWQPMYPDFPAKEVRSIFETAGGSVFIITGFWVSSSQLYKSTDNGKTWKPLLAGGMVTKMLESNGVLLATGSKGIIRSTDDGETWETVISDGGLGMNIEGINGGFAAITFSSASNTSRLRTSYDGGKTWQAIDADLPADYHIYSMVQVDENFFCNHPKGIFRSSDKGKTWKLLLPATEERVFNLSVSGGVVYAIAGKKGC